MPKVRNSSGAIGTMRGPISLSLTRSLSSRTSAIVVATDCLPDPCFSSAYTLSPGSFSGLARTTRRGSEPPSCLRRSSMYSISGASAPGWKSGNMPVLLVGLVDVAVADREVEPVAEPLGVVEGELLHLVGGVAALERLDRPALDRLGQDHRRLADVLGGGVERGVHLAVVVAAARQLADLLVAHVLDHPAQPRVAAEEVLADVLAGLDRVGLELAVRGGVHPVDEHAVDVAGEQRVPLAAPHDLDDVPAGAAEERLELLDDLAVAADRAVELLQVAVDDEREVVELLARGEADGAERLRLAHLAVAEERPHVLLAGVLDAAVLQVAVEPGLVDRVERPDAHGHRGELPEVRHQPGVRVRRQPLPGTVLHLLAEPEQLLLGEPALEERPGVDAGGGVALDEDLVAAARVVLAAEEVVEADLVERRGRLVGGDVAADLEPLAVGVGDHDRGVPADERADPALDVLVAGEPRLALRRDRVDVVGAAQAGHADLLLPGPLEQLEHEVAGTLAAAVVDQLVEGIEPLAGLVGVDVRELGGQPAEDDGRGRRGCRVGVSHVSILAAWRSTRE